MQMMITFEEDDSGRPFLKTKNQKWLKGAFSMPSYMDQFLRFGVSVGQINPGIA